MAIDKIVEETKYLTIMCSNFEQQYLTDLVKEALTTMTFLKRLSLVQNKNKMKEAEAEIHLIKRLAFAVEHEQIEIIQITQQQNHQIGYMMKSFKENRS